MAQFRPRSSTFFQPENLRPRGQEVQHQERSAALRTLSTSQAHGQRFIAAAFAILFQRGDAVGLSVLKQNLCSHLSSLSRIGCHGSQIVRERGKPDQMVVQLEEFAQHHPNALRPIRPPLPPKLSMETILFCSNRQITVI